MNERGGGDWFADEEGNLSAPGDEPSPTTDEYGRDDPDVIERERRRREREERRRGKKGAGSDGAGGGGLGGLLGRGRRKAAPPPEEAPPQEEPTDVQPAARRPRRQAKAAPAEPAEPRPSLGERAAAGREALRSRFGRGGGGEKPPPSNPGTFRRRRIAAIALALVGVLALWFLVALFQPPPFDPGDGEGTVAVTVPEGATAGDVADLLTKNDVVSSGSLFQLRLRLAGKSDSILPGRYVLASNMSYGAAMDRLTGTGDKVSVTIPEGQDRSQIGPEVNEVGIDGNYEQASKSFQGFNPAAFGAANPPNLEGFLFPATYELDRGANVQTLVGQQLDAFQQNMKQVDLSYAQKKNLTVYDVLIIASMIDKEVMVDKERPLVAAVIYNRLSKGMPLGIDATTRYEYHNYEDQLTQQQLNTASPYNTRLKPGLPPTPIGNPGLEAIKAAAQPAQVNYLFYVVKPGSCGEHNFTASEAEFEQLAQQYQQALEAQGGSPTEC